MTISAMRKKCVLLCLAMCLVLSSFHEVSCQAEGNRDFNSLDDQEFDDKNFPSNLNINFEEGESQSSKSKSESKISWEESNELTEEKTSSVDVDISAKSEDLSSHAEGSGLMDKVDREIGAHIDDLNKQAGSDGVFSESMDASKIDSISKAESRKVLEDFERKMEVKAESATKYVEEIELTKKKSKVETRETKVEEDESADDESDKNQIYYAKKGGKESSSSGQQYESTKSSGIMGSLGLRQSAGWRCINQDTNGVKDDDDVPIVIPKYELNEIIKEESFSQGSTSKTSSLIESLSKMVETHRNKKWTSTVGIGKITHKSKETVRLETVEKLKVTLKRYRSLRVRDLVDRSDFEQILAIAAQYEEVSLAKTRHISTLSMYKSVIIEGKKASVEAKIAHTRIETLKRVVNEKNENVQAEFASVKALAKRGDMLSVKIFAIKKLLLELEAEKKEVDKKFQTATGNLSRVLEEASEAEEKYHLTVRTWRQEESYVKYSEETIQKAEMVWAQFIDTLEETV